MARKIRHESTVQKTGNILRTVLIWSGFTLAVLAGMLLAVAPGNERVSLALVIAGMLAYGFALHDFDTDDDD